MQEEQVLEILKMQGKSKEDLYGDWRDNAAASLKKQLVVANLVEKEGISLEDGDYEAELEKQSEKANMKLDEFKDYINKNRLEDYIKSDMKNDKLLDMILESTTVKKGKKLTYTQLITPEESK